MPEGKNGTKELETNIGIVGTEAKSTKEKIVKHRRKIWSLPIAVLALALMLVGGIVATGIVQAFGDAPKMGTQIEDQEIQIGADADGSGVVGAPTGNVTIDLTNVGGDGIAAFTDVGTADSETTDDPLAYTVLTSDYKVANVALSNADGAPVTLLTSWWDSLGNGDAGENEEDTNCSKRAARLGFTAGGPLTPEQISAMGAADPPQIPNPHRAGRNGDAEATPSVAVIDATGLCADYTDASGTNLTDEDADTAVVELLTGANAILQAFHWDMLSGRQMIVAAQSGGLSNPGNYAKSFADLTPGQRRNVETLYNAPLNVLARGSGTLTLDNLGIDSDTTNNNDLPGETDPPTTDGEAGTATIYVKVSDDTGRLIPPGNGSDTVGQTFSVTASLTPTGDVFAFATGGDATNTLPADPGDAPVGTFVTAAGVAGSSTGVAYVAANPETDALHRYDLT